MCKVFVRTSLWEWSHLQQAFNDSDCVLWETLTWVCLRVSGFWTLVWSNGHTDTNFSAVWLDGEWRIWGECGKGLHTWCWKVGLLFSFGSQLHDLEVGMQPLWAFSLHQWRLLCHFENCIQQAIWWRFETSLSVCVLVTQSCPTLCDPMNCGHSLLQEIFTIVQTQGLNLGLLRCRQILYRLSHQENPCNLCMRAKSCQLCPTLCDPMDCSPPGPSVCGILQARIPEWVAMLSSRGSSQPRDGTPVSYISCIKLQIGGMIFFLWHVHTTLFFNLWVFIAVCELSLVGLLSGCCVWALGCGASVVVAHSLGSCSLRILEHSLGSCSALA